MARGNIITFYSYKGGTGRSMALANVACILAEGDVDRKVLVIDWDLEAPGLHRYFAPYIKRDDLTREEFEFYFNGFGGVIDYFVELQTHISQPTPDESQNEEQARDLVAAVDFDKYVLKTTLPNLYFVKAGRNDAQYPQLINDFDWEKLHRSSPWLFQCFAEKLSLKYTHILIDSRTGLTDTSGICTKLLPDRLVLVFTPNTQNMYGAIDVVRNVTAYRQSSDDIRPLLILPLPARVELAEPILLADWRLGNATMTTYGYQEISGYQKMFESVFREVYSIDTCNLRRYFDEIQIQQVPRYAYGESIACLVERTDDRLSLSRAFRVFAARLVSNTEPWKEIPTREITELEREDAKKKLVNLEEENRNLRSRKSAITMIIVTALFIGGIVISILWQAQLNKSQKIKELAKQAAIADVNQITITKMEADMYQQGRYACTFNKLVDLRRVDVDGRIGPSGNEFVSDKIGYAFKIQCGTDDKGNQHYLLKAESPTRDYETLCSDESRAVWTATDSADADLTCPCDTPEKKFQKQFGREFNVCRTEYLNHQGGNHDQQQAAP